MQIRNYYWAVAFLLVTLVSARASYAQGSAYDLLGFGMPLRSSNAVQDALGGAGVALEGTQIVNDINPADWTWLTRARFTASMRYNFYNETGTLPGQGSVNDQQYNVLFNGATFGAPIYAPWNAAIAFGYVPLTDASEEINENNSSATGQYFSKGGTNLVFAGMAARPVPALALGARLDFMTGDIRHMDEVSFADDTNASSGNFERDYYYSGFRPTFGLELIGDSIGGVLKGFTLGASYSLAANLNATEETIVTPSSSTLDTAIDAGGVGRYPSALAAGISYHLSPRWRTEADYFTQNFTSAYVYSPQAISGDSNLGPSSRFSFGIERLPNITGEYGTSMGLDRWALRFGLAYATLPVYPSGSGGVREFSISGGVGLPVSIQTMLDLSLVAGQRVPINLGGSPKETFIRLTADFSFSETWFVPTQRKQ